MKTKKITALTIPLFPYLRAGERNPGKMKRIRPADSLDLRGMISEMRTSEIAAFDAGNGKWSATSVYSAYSPDIHLMLIETSPNRYVPGPEKIPDQEGDRLMKIWACILDLTAERKTVATIHAGYNWSPRSWGEEEEKTGFQSVPTKWHPHFWGWPSFRKNTTKKEWEAKGVSVSSLSAPLRRLSGENNYSKPFGKLIKERMGKKFSKGSLFNKLLPVHKWVIDERGVYTGFNSSVPEVLKAPGFFGCCLKPLAAMLEEIMRELSETFTTIRCKEIDRILAGTQKGIPKNLKALRAAPVMRDEGYIRKVFKLRGYPSGLLGALLQPVRNRCNQAGNPADWWRKGFAYALVFHGPASQANRDKRGELRIMPGVYVGPGGVVEAEGFIITRPEDRKFSDAEIRRKSKDLRKLAEGLKESGFRH